MSNQLIYCLWNLHFSLLKIRMACIYLQYSRTSLLLYSVLKYIYSLFANLLCKLSQYPRTKFICIGIFEYVYEQSVKYFSIIFFNLGLQFLYDNWALFLLMATLVILLSVKSTSFSLPKNTERKYVPKRFSFLCDLYENVPHAPGLFPLQNY